MFQGEIVAARLKELRIKNRCKQLEVARGLGVNQSIVSDHENGRSLPSCSALCWYSQRYGVSTDYILGLIDTPFHESFPDPIAEAQTIIPESDFTSPEKIKAYIDALVEESVNKAVDRKLQK